MLKFDRDKNAQYIVDKKIEPGDKTTVPMTRKEHHILKSEDMTPCIGT